MVSLLLLLSFLSTAVSFRDPEEEEEEEGDRVTEVVPGLSKKGKLYNIILSHEIFICL